MNPAPYTATTAADPNATRLPAFLLFPLTLAFLLGGGGMLLSEAFLDTQTPPASLRTVFGEKDALRNNQGTTVNGTLALFVPHSILSVPAPLAGSMWNVTSSTGAAVLPTFMGARPISRSFMYGTPH